MIGQILNPSSQKMLCSSSANYPWAEILRVSCVSILNIANLYLSSVSKTLRCNSLRRGAPFSGEKLLIRRINPAALGPNALPDLPRKLHRVQLHPRTESCACAASGRSSILSRIVARGIIGPSWKKTKNINKSHRKREGSHYRLK